MSFILQGGFAEASQLRCGEAYLEILPSYFNCEYNGTRIKEDNFGSSWMPEDMAEKMVAHYEKMGRSFAEKEAFYKEEVNEFAAPEYFSEKEIRQHKRIGRWMQRYRSMMGEYIIFHTDIDTEQKTNGIRYVPMKFKK